jgi:hypothetical protein
MVDGPPVLPLLHNLLAIQKHVAKNNSSWVSSALLAIVDHKGVSDVLGKRAIKLMLEVVQIVVGGTLA